MKPLISVITPTLNVASTIRKTLDSVSGQTYKQIEHIIVDGLSEDDTAKILELYIRRHKHIRLYREKDTGVYDAMNKALHYCNGDFIIFLGSDDEFYNDRILEELVAEGHFDDQEVIYGNVYVKGEAGWAGPDHIYDGPFDTKKLLYKNICHQSIFYPANIVKKAGYYNTRYSVTADWDYNLRCWAFKPFRYVDKIIAFFKAGGASSSGGDKAFGDEKAENVIRYFGIDPWDGEFDKPGSPFFYLVGEYRKNNKQNANCQNQKQPSV